MGELAGKAVSLGLVHETSLAITAVPLPGLVFGVAFLERWDIREPGGMHWREAEYASYSPWVFTIPDARVNSAAGIVCVDSFVIAEPLVNAASDGYGFTRHADGVWIDDEPVLLQGTQITTLAPGAPANYYHTLIDAVGRLAMLSDAVLGRANGLLATVAGSSPATWLRDRVAEHWKLSRTDLASRTSLRVERLVMAGPHHTGVSDYHPSLTVWFDAKASHADCATNTPEAFYIERRGAAARPLMNEPDLVASLRPLGIVSVALERLSALAQIALFRNARLIVAPHGAGLANLAFARPGCRVLELQMDAYCNWCFRRLAAVKGLGYDCVLGRAVGPWLDLAGAVHAMRWQVSVPHVVAAVEAMLAR